MSTVAMDADMEVDTPAVAGGGAGAALQDPLEQLARASLGEIQSALDGIGDPPTDDELDTALTSAQLSLDVLFPAVDDKLAVMPRFEADDKYTAFAVNFNNDVAAAFDSADLAGYKIRGTTLVGPPPASTSRFSGGSRADKADDLTHWDGSMLPADLEATKGDLAALNATIASDYKEIRHASLDYSSRGSAAERRPGQSASMGQLLPNAELAPGEDHGSVSPNKLRGTVGGDARQSTEWLHMVARSDGNNVNLHGAHEQHFANKVQEPANLVAGSYAANTMMMAVESQGTNPNANKFTKDVRAFSGSGKEHDADLIQYALTNSNSGESRNYFMDARQGSHAPLAEYYNMTLDAEEFMNKPDAPPGTGPSAYASMDKDQTAWFMSRDQAGMKAEIKAWRAQWKEDQAQAQLAGQVPDEAACFTTWASMQP